MIFFTASGIRRLWLSSLLVLALITPNALGAVNSVSDVILFNTLYRTVLAASESMPVMFPIEHSATDNIRSAHVKWEMELNADSTLSFKYDGSYLRATSTAVSLVQKNNPGNYEKFFIEKFRDSFYILTYDGNYLQCPGMDKQPLSQMQVKGESTRWHFFKEQDPYLLDDGIILNQTGKILAAATVSGETFLAHSHSVLGLTENTWARWDIKNLENGNVRLKVSNWKYLSASLTELNAYANNNPGENEEFTLIFENNAYYVKTQFNQYISQTYLYSVGLHMVDERVDQARWHFVNTLNPIKYFELPSANAGAVQSIASFETVTLDASASKSHNGEPISYSWSFETIPAGSFPALLSPNTVNPKFSPDMAGEYVLRLTVTDNLGKKASSLTRVFLTQMAVQEADNPIDEEEELVKMGSNFDATPAVFANMQWSIDLDTANVRVNNVGFSDFTMKVEEETSWDPESSHFPEIVGYLAINDGRLADINGNIIGEVGRLNWSQASSSTWGIVDLLNTYTYPVVIMMQNTINGKNPSHVRVKGVGSDNFQFKIEEWLYQDGKHTEETLVYMVVEAGVHTLANGQILEASLSEVNYSGKEISFQGAFSEKPVVLSQTQTYQSDIPVVTRNHITSADKCSVVLQREEAEHKPSYEDVGIIIVGR